MEDGHGKRHIRKPYGALLGVWELVIDWQNTGSKPGRMPEALWEAATATT